MLISIGEAALLVGVCPATLRRWEREGKIIPDARTPGGHRRYLIENLKFKFGLITKTNERRSAVGYARVSSSDQRADLERQLQTLRGHLEESKEPYLLIADMGSGLNFKKRGLTKLIHLIITGQISRLVLTHRDRLLRFGCELIFDLCRHYETQITILNETHKLDEQLQLSRDVIELMVVFSARLYGRRSHENRKRSAKVKAV